MKALRFDICLLRRSEGNRLEDLVRLGLWDHLSFLCLDETVRQTKTDLDPAQNRTGDGSTYSCNACLVDLHMGPSPRKSRTPSFQIWKGALTVVSGD